MNPPVDGFAGAVWRSLTFPARALAPLVLLLRRAVTGEYWIETVHTRPGSGPHIEVSSRQKIQKPRDGTGPLNHRTYTARIEQSRVTPQQLVEAFRTDPNRFCPTSYATFVPEPAPEGLSEGDDYEVKLPGPWDGPIFVRFVKPLLVRLETLGGHMEAGWIQFTGSEADGITVFEIESLARSGDPVFDYLYHSVGIGKHFQTEMWVQVLEAAVEVSGGSQQGRIGIQTIIYEG